LRATGAYAIPTSPAWKGRLLMMSLAGLGDVAAEGDVSGVGDSAGGGAVLGVEVATELDGLDSGDCPACC
jgi:hypothetical protein